MQIMFVLSVEAGSPEYKIIPDKDKMQRLGLTTAYVGINLRTAFTGNDDATLNRKRNRVSCKNLVG